MIRFSKLFLFVLIATTFSSCIIEDESDVEYSIINETQSSIKIIRLDVRQNLKTLENDTFLLAAGESKLIESWYGMGGPAFTVPQGSDSMIFTKNDTLLKGYGNYYTIKEKNPYNESSYDGGKVSEKKHLTSYQYFYRIKEEDFK